MCIRDSAGDEHGERPVQPGGARLRPLHAATLRRAAPAHLIRATCPWCWARTIAQLRVLVPVARTRSCATGTGVRNLPSACPREGQLRGVEQPQLSLRRAVARAGPSCARSLVRNWDLGAQSAE